MPCRYAAVYFRCLYFRAMPRRFDAIFRHLMLFRHADAAIYVCYYVHFDAAA